MPERPLADEAEAPRTFPCQEHRISVEYQIIAISPDFHTKPSEASSIQQTTTLHRTNDIRIKKASGNPKRICYSSI